MQFPDAIVHRLPILILNVLQVSHLLACDARQDNICCVGHFAGLPVSALRSTKPSPTVQIKRGLIFGNILGMTSAATYASALLEG